MTDRVDLAIIGGGIVGLATALRLTESRPDLRVAILEKEPELATHQSGHNSGVLHAGLYYAPGSLKARLCRQGKAELEAFAEAHGIPVRYPGKLVVALTEDELARLADIKSRATANGVEGLEEIGPERIRELEPQAAGIRALWSPRTGIIDFRAVALAYADDLRGRGVAIHTARRVTGIDQRSDGVVLSTPAGELQAGHVIACAGLHADRVAAMTGESGRDVPRIVPFRGDYYTLTPEARSLVSRLIYPVPDPRFPFLGVHFTPRHDGEVWAGPNAVLAFAREGYRPHRPQPARPRRHAYLPRVPATRDPLLADGADRDVARPLEAGLRPRAAALPPGDPRRPGPRSGRPACAPRPSPMTVRWSTTSAWAGAVGSSTCETPPPRRRPPAWPSAGCWPTARSSASRSPSGRRAWPWPG